MTIEEALRGVDFLGIDTPIFIYLVEKNADYIDRVREIARQIDQGDLMGRSSTVALAEVLPIPLRAGDAAIEKEYKDLLLHSRNFALVPVDVVIAERTAELRARFNLKTPDALHVATAIVAGCGAFLTNDTGLKRVTDIPVLILDDLTL